jgi:hypothetical protein
MISLVLGLAAFVLFVSGCSDDDNPVSGSAEATYIGADSCGVCHPTKHADWTLSGHPYKMNKVVGGVPPTYPYSTVPSPPSGWTWDNITYVIGGYGWKARFLDTAGYIITGTDVQYNLPRIDIGAPSPEWSGYHPELARKPYTCGECHTTGWQTLAENGGVHQDSLEGIEGTWFETGITCERCHGQGSVHAETQSAADININRSKDLCGECHFRDVNHGILAKGGFIRHHEQFDELISAGHVGRLCNDCHDPHQGSRYASGAGGIKTECTSCHADKTTNKHNGVPDCVSCHMPRATKSARAVNEHTGDVRTHIFKIRTDAVPKDSMFFDSDGSTWSRGYVTLDFACYGCHKDTDTGAGGPHSVKSLDALSVMATGIHD